MFISNWLKLFQTWYKIDEYCEDADDGALDELGLSCYNYFDYMCAESFDANDDDFNAQNMCCICGGGIKHGKKWTS